MKDDLNPILVEDTTLGKLVLSFNWSEQSHARTTFYFIFVQPATYALSNYNSTTTYQPYCLFNASRQPPPTSHQWTSLPNPTVTAHHPTSHLARGRGGGIISQPLGGRIFKIPKAFISYVSPKNRPFVSMR